MTVRGLDAELSMYDRLAQSIRDRVDVAVATALDGPRPGAKMLVFLDGSTFGTIGDAALDRQIVVGALNALRNERSESRSYAIESAENAQAEVLVFFEPNVPPPNLIIVGAGHTSIPLAEMGKIAGFSVTLIDARAAFASNERFRTVDEVIVDWPHRVLANRPITGSTYVAVLTHDPKFEEPLLPILLRSAARYIGVIGSRKTQQQRRERLREEGFDERDIARLSGPIGLDIGAVTPEEIAVSILAQIVAKRHGRPGGHLGETQRPAGA